MTDLKPSPNQTTTPQARFGQDRSRWIRANWENPWKEASIGSRLQRLRTSSTRRGLSPNTGSPDYHSETSKTTCNEEQANPNVKSSTKSQSTNITGVKENVLVFNMRKKAHRKLPPRTSRHRPPLQNQSRARSPRSRRQASEVATAEQRRFRARSSAAQRLNRASTRRSLGRRAPQHAKASSVFHQARPPKCPVWRRRERAMPHA